MAYVPFKGKVYELDGLKGGPVDLGTFAAGDWLPTARAAIETRIQKYAASEIKFNLMAIVRDKRMVLDERQKSAEAEAAAAGDDVAASAKLANALADIESERAIETAKRAAWTQENIRRHHNYIPLCIDLFKVLAEKGKLKAMIEDAKTKGAAAAKKQKL